MPAIFPQKQNGHVVKQVQKSNTKIDILSTMFVKETFLGVGYNEEDKKDISHWVRAPKQQILFQVSRQLFDKNYFNNNSL